MAFYVLFVLLALCSGQTTSPTTSPSPTPSTSISRSSTPKSTPSPCSAPPGYFCNGGSVLICPTGAYCAGGSAPSLSSCPMANCNAQGSPSNYTFNTTGRFFSYVWNFSTPGFTLSSAVVDNSGNVLLSSWNGNLYSLNSSNGTVNWRFYCGSAFQSLAPAVSPLAPNFAWVGFNPSSIRMYGINLYNGSVL